MKEKDKMKAFKIIGVKNGKPVEKEIDNFDEQAARAEFDNYFDDCMNEQHFQKERWDR